MTHPDPVSVLLVDDEPASLLALEAVLDGLGLNLVKAISGEEALRLPMSDDFAVALLDIRLPGIDGFETARLMRDQGRLTPVIFLTAYDTSEFPAEEAYALGAVDFLVKPNKPVVLRAKVAGFVEVYRRQARADAELRRVNRARDEFLAMLAHELRNPMSPMLTGLQVLRLSGANREAAEWAVNLVERQVRHMARLVDDLLDVSRITRGRIQLRRERLDLGRLVRTTVADNRGRCDEAGVNVEVDVPETPVWVQGDPTRLSQVVYNLLSNACKFTDRGGRVEVSLTADPGMGQVELRVKDTGVGIEPEVLPQLFTPFSQADRSLERARGGLGLGLALVKGLVELNGGEVEARSEGPGKGAEFVVRLPLEGEPAALTGLPAGPPHADKPLRVLVIEDNRDAAESLRMLLDLLGHEVRVAHTGPEGVQVADQWRPDVILCDIGLPGLDGYGVAGELKKRPSNSRTRLIAITGYGTEEDKRRALQAGYEYHLTKPADPAKLLELLTVAG
jgi:signal transduction histidine kinase